MTPKREPFVLSLAEKNLGVWQKIVAEMQYRLETHRLRNDSPEMTEMQRGVLIGRILEAKEILNWDKPPKEVPS